VRFSNKVCTFFFFTAKKKKALFFGKRKKRKEAHKLKFKFEKTKEKIIIEWMKEFQKVEFFSSIQNKK
jgi:hypothetical protein